MLNPAIRGGELDDEDIFRRRSVSALKFCTNVSASWYVPELMMLSTA